MMEYLFRGKTFNGEWVEGDLIHYGNNQIYILPQNRELWDVCCDGTEVIPETVGQYIGAKDITGKNKIFSGDIIVNEHGNIYAVKHKIQTYSIDGYGDCTSTTTMGYSLSNYGYSHNNFSKCRIVGNIYDNPEYLQDDARDMFKPKNDTSKNATPEDFVYKLKRISIFGTMDPNDFKVPDHRLDMNK